MRNITVICVGKLKEKYLRDAVNEYAKRLSAFCKFSVFEVEEERTADNPSSSQIAAVIEAEGKRIIQRIPKNAFTVALCIEGEQVSSEKLSQRLLKEAVSGNSSAAFIIGGSWGLCEQVKSESDWRLSMSEMTFPHQLARVMLCEQLYRSFQIINNGKYHK